MKPEELYLIESKLGIELPEAYKHAVDPYPIQALRGNTDWMFWDDADSLIALNIRMREGEKFREPWPRRFFALGEDAGGSSDAIDLEDPEYGVFWFDRQHIDITKIERSEEKLEGWIARQIEESNHDLESDGIDPLMMPEQKQAMVENNNKVGNFPLFGLALLISLVIIAYILAG